MDEGVLLKLVSFGDEYTKDVANNLANSLSFDFFDLSKQDTCNQQIFRDVIDFTSDNLKNTFILIGWTHSKRLEIHWKEKFTYRPDVNEYIDNGLNSLHRFDDILFNDILLTQHWASEAYTLQQVLAFKNVKYYMYNTQDCMYYHKKTKPYIDALCKVHYHNPINLHSSINYQKEDFLLGKIHAGGIL